MKLNSQDLKKIAELTLGCYNQNAEDFWEGTRNHDVSQNIAALLQHIESERPFTILDFGCGPGRDLKVFAELGHIAIGLEGATHLAAMARAYSGCEVWQQDFLKLDLPENYFDGVFANASLFHVPSQELPRVLLELRACLKPGGVLFSSNPRGHNEEGWNDGRYGTYLDLKSWRRFVSSAGFVELTHCPSLGRMYAVRGPYSKAVGQCPKTGGFASSPQTMCLPGGRSSSGLSDREWNEEAPRSDQGNICPPALTFSTFSATEPHAQVIINTVGPDVS